MLCTRVCNCDLHYFRRWNHEHIPGVEKDKFEIEAGAEHEHVAVKFDLRDGAARQRVTDGNKSSVLIAAVERRSVHCTLTYFQITAAMNYLYQT